jgi:hypothetical protein
MALRQSNEEQSRPAKGDQIPVFGMLLACFVALLVCSHALVPGRKRRVSTDACQGLDLSKDRVCGVEVVNAALLSQVVSQRLSLPTKKKLSSSSEYHVPAMVVVARSAVLCGMQCFVTCLE